MKYGNFTKSSKLLPRIILNKLDLRKQYEVGGNALKRKVMMFLFIVILSTLFACTKKEEPITEVAPIEPLLAELTVTNTVEIDETVTMKTIVTLGDEKIEDADEVVYEVWEEGKKSDSEMIESVHKGEGVYLAETTFAHDGTFSVQVHVTARAQHTMPIETVTVGDGGEYEEDTAHDYHTEGFSMHFMKPIDVKAENEAELLVHIELEGAPLEKLNVRYEIWHEGNPDKHEWIDTKEVAAGEYQAAYTFLEAESYTVVVHVEDDEDLHEHEEHTIEVK